MERGCSQEMVKERWESSMYTSNDVPWFQRNYNCSFCKREFNSAQALGGHMNVHRRDRARLRLQLPSLVLDQVPNPNPNRNVSSSSITLQSPTYLSYYSSHSSVYFPSKTTSPSFSTSQKRSSIASEVKDTRSMKYCKPDCFDGSGGHETISLDLEMMSKEPAEVLDLELRLGH